MWNWFRRWLRGEDPEEMRRLEAERDAAAQRVRDALKETRQECCVPQELRQLAEGPDARKEAA